MRQGVSCVTPVIESNPFQLPVALLPRQCVVLPQAAGKAQTPRNAAPGQLAFPDRRNHAISNRL